MYLSTAISRSDWEILCLFCAVVGSCLADVEPGSAASLSEEGPEHLYKAAKEAFVTGLSGTTMSEVMLVAMPVPMGLWLLGEVKALGQLLVGGDRWPLRAWQQFLLEFSCVVLPVLAAVLRPHSAAPMLAAIALASAGMSLFVRSYDRSSLPDTMSAAEKPPETRQALVARWKRERADALYGPHKSFVTNFRSGVMIITCVTILAVDFQAFPRRLAKTEVFGTGLMDLGVGAVIFAGGIVSGRPPPPRSPEARGVGGGPRQSGMLGLARDLGGVLAKSWPLAALGLSRLILVKLLGYQEHVSEYGVHWNFFLTVISVRLAVTLLRRLCREAWRLPVAGFVLVVYQVALRWGGLSEYVIGAPRGSNLFSQNREGVLGVAGFLTIQLLAEEVGRRVLWGPPAKKTATVLAQCRYSLLQLGLVDAALWALALLSRMYIQDTSRRLTNLTYVLWCCAHVLLLLAVLMAVELLSTGPPRCQLSEAVNRNMFAVFMIANLATGVVNLCMQTLFAGTATACMVLMLYLLGVFGVAALLDHHKMYLKV